MSNIIHNEQVKLKATFCNNLAIFCLATGILIPALSLTLRTQDMPILTKLFVAGFGLLGAFVFHYAARGFLRELKE